MSFYRPRYVALKLAGIIVVTLVQTPSAWSWGRVSHRVAAEMAEARLSPTALAAVRDLLEAGVSLADISTWADEQRITQSAPGHYVDVPITESRYNPKYCPPAGYVVSKIEDFKQGKILTIFRKDQRGNRKVAMDTAVADPAM